MNFFDGHAFSLYDSTPDHQGESRHVPVYYGVQYNHAGRFRFALNHGPVMEYEGAYAFVTHPGAFFEYGNVPGETRHHSFLCSHGERVGKYVESGLLPTGLENPVRKIADPDRFLGTMLRIMQLLRRSAPLTPPRAVLLYEDLLLQFHESELAEPRLPAFQEEYFRHLVSEVRHHPEKPWDFAAEAAKRSLTPHHFRRLFKTVAGLPPRQFLIRCRLELAATLLTGSPHPVGVVAELCGIGSEFYFSRLFKEKFNLSPLKYRREFPVGRGGRTNC